MSRIPLEQAQELIAGSVSPLNPVFLALKGALGCRLAQNVTAPISQPPFPRSPFDGYALKAADSAGASSTAPVTLKVVGKSYAGSPAHTAVGAGQAVRIMTGGAIPDGADCVIMQEKTNFGEDSVEIYLELAPHANYCDLGEDYSAGEILAEKGTVIHAAECAVFAGAGIQSVMAVPLPKVAVAATGDELQSPGESLKPGHIYNSNSAFINARLHELGISSTDLGQVSDTLEALESLLASAVGTSDMVITTGGVSVGQKDLVPAALEVLGAEIIFHGVAVKPGMPATLALLGGKPILALSGNPFAAAVTFELLGRRVIAALSSNTSLLPAKTQFVMENSFSKRRPCIRYQRGSSKNGQVWVPPSQGNGQMRTMMGCDCLVELPAGEDPIDAGTVVTAYML